VAGHSLGEYAALVAAGVLSFPDDVQLVTRRARLMQDAVPAGQGGMAAVLGLDDDRVATICESIGSGGIVEPVNFNAPGQVVIAGDASAVQEAMTAAREAGAKRVLELSVSVPAHSTLMKDAAEQLAEAFADVTFRKPRIPVIHNVDAAQHQEVDEIREALRRQLYNPVRWTETVAALRSHGIDQLVELGPGKVLTGLARRIDRRLAAAAVEDPATLATALAACKGDQT